MKNTKVWFITGASRGFGRVWTEAALQRGDKVVATARSLSSIADLSEKFGDNVLPLALDVTKLTKSNRPLIQPLHILVK
jgi:NADP-dependent 3-hydroxy acid dehydrogenase YdfG